MAEGGGEPGGQGADDAQSEEEEEEENHTLDPNWMAMTGYEGLSFGPGAVGSLACATEHELRGVAEEIGPGVVYVSEPRGAKTGPARCVMLCHDADGFRSGRHRQLADAFATQGWIAMLPDFSVYSEDREKWLDSIKSFLVDFLLPWLEDRKVVGLQCIGFSNGANICAMVAQAYAHYAEDCRWAAERSKQDDKLTSIRLVGSVLVNPLFAGTSAKARMELQKMISCMDYPLLIMPCKEDPPDVREGGLIHQQSKAHGRSLEFIEFSRVEHGFVTHGTVMADEVRLGVEWAMEVATEFFHAQFLKAEPA